jgi:hypothetical protein
VALTSGSPAFKKSLLAGQPGPRPPDMAGGAAGGGGWSTYPALLQICTLAEFTSHQVNSKIHILHVRLNRDVSLHEKDFLWLEVSTVSNKF